MADVFFGYPSYPHGPSEVMRSTASGLRRQGISARTWQNLAIDGRVVISAILDEIDQCACVIFDLTYQNPNVVFELAYAVARGKPVRITIDKTVTGAITEFNELATLKPLAYTTYFNSADLTSHLLGTPPWHDEKTAYDDLIDPILPEESQPRNVLLYCPTYEPFEASARLNTFISERQTRGTTVIVSDPNEASFEPITWIAPTIMRSAGVLVHFAGDQRKRSDVFNIRHAITAGMALGLDTPLLMLAESQYSRPFDYEALLKTYEYSRECVQYARAWLEDLKFEGVDWNRPRRTPPNPLIKLKFGEHVAENELNDLADYFVETSAFF